jgi:hypothetical protein
MSYDVDVADEWFNYTWNMSEFFRDFGVHPYTHMDGKLAPVVAEKIRDALGAIETHSQEALSLRYDAENGWGSVKTATAWLESVRSACERHPYAFVKAG